MTQGILVNEQRALASLNSPSRPLSEVSPEQRAGNPGMASWFGKWTLYHASLRVVYSKIEDTLRRLVCLNQIIDLSGDLQGPKNEHGHTTTVPTYFQPARKISQI